METWFILSTATPLLYAFINQIDKYLLDKYFKEGGVGTLLLFSSLFSFFAIPYAIFMDPTVFGIRLQNMAIMYAVGLMNVLLLFCYLKAMQDDEPAVVVLYYQIVPVIALAIGYFLLGERITPIQGIAMVVILSGTTLATFQIAKSDLNSALDAEGAVIPNIRFKWRTFGYMIVAASCWAGETTLGKVVVLSESVYHSIFWESVAMISWGVVLFVCVAKYRKQFVITFKENSRWVLSLCVANEALYGLGNAIITHAIAIQVVAIVLLLQPLQTLFVFFLSIILAFVPGMQREKKSAGFMLQMGVAIAITGFGSYLLHQ